MLQLTQMELRALNILLERKIRDGSQQHQMNEFELNGECRSIREKIAKLEREENQN